MGLGQSLEDCLRAFLSVHLVSFLLVAPLNPDKTKSESNAVFSRERFTTVTAYPGFVTKSRLLETLFTRN